MFPSFWNIWKICHLPIPKREILRSLLWTQFAGHLPLFWLTPFWTKTDEKYCINLVQSSAILVSPLYIYIYIFPRRFWHTLTLARLTKFHGRMFKGLIYAYVTYSLFVEIVRNKAINCLIMLGCNILFVDFVNATLNDGQLFVEIELLKREKWKCI